MIVIATSTKGSRIEEPKSGFMGTSEIAPHVLTAARRGDRGAFVDLLHFYDRRLRHVAWQTLRDPQAMDDVLQEVALRAFRGLPSFREESGVGTWLCRIAYTTCLDHLRRRAHEMPPAPEDPGVEPAGGDPADDYLARRTFDEAFAALSDEQRIAVLLVDREGLDYRSAADILGISSGTLGSRLFNARATLRAALAPDTKETIS
jgi:RNA polymerase sigma-70 factor, ECF subfamily